MRKESYSKYRAKKCEYDGYTYASKFEAGVAQELDLRLRAGEIKDWERQFKIECIPYDKNGTPMPDLKVSHKVDFRVHELDGSFTLVEAKGQELSDWQHRRKWLERVWLPEHPDHTYQVVKDGGSGRGLRWSKQSMKSVNKKWR